MESSATGKSDNNFMEKKSTRISNLMLLYVKFESEHHICCFRSYYQYTNHYHKNYVPTYVVTLVALTIHLNYWTVSDRIIQQHFQAFT